MSNENAVAGSPACGGMQPKTRGCFFSIANPGSWLVSVFCHTFRWGLHCAR